MTYDDKLNARRERFESKAETAKQQGAALYAQAHKMADAIPFGQPILIGHHSESRDRNYRGRIQKTFARAFDELDKAKHYQRKADNVGKSGISSDDPEAIPKLRFELEQLDAAHAQMKAVNRAIRSHPEHAEQAARLVEMGFSQADVDRVLKKDPMGRIGFPSYALQNNRANASRVKDRIEEIEAMRSRTNAEFEGQGYTYREDVQENRVMFFFEGKPDEATRALLKRSGFKWSPSRDGKPWVRQLTTAGINTAKEVRKALDKQMQNQPSEE